MRSSPSGGPRPPAIVKVGSVRGRALVLDRAGRFLAVQRGGDKIAMYDADAELAEVFAIRTVGPTAALAIHPAGRALARATDNGVEVHRPDRSATRSGPGSSRKGAWLEFSADGEHLFHGDVADPGGARVSL